LGRATPLITPKEMWTDAAIMEGINETARYCISVYAFCVDDLKGVGDIAAFAVPHERLTEVVDVIRRDSIRIQFHLFFVLGNKFSPELQLLCVGEDVDIT
jgi:hypothetical protein